MMATTMPATTAFPESCSSAVNGNLFESLAPVSVVAVVLDVAGPVASVVMVVLDVAGPVASLVAVVLDVAGPVASVVAVVLDVAEPVVVGYAPPAQ
jgi:hypothetical protein